MVSKTRLDKQLKKIISRMRKIQRNIAADESPASMHEVDELKKLGQRYTEIVAELSQLRTEAAVEEPGQPPPV